MPATLPSAVYTIRVINDKTGAWRGVISPLEYCLGAHEQGRENHTLLPAAFEGWFILAVKCAYVCASLAATRILHCFEATGLRVLKN